MKEYSGTAIVKEQSQLSYDLNRIVHLKNGTFMSLPRIHDIPTEEEQELNLFARDINRNMPKDVPQVINRRYEITLFIDSLGRPYLHNYHVMIKDSIDNIVLSHLDSLIRINQYDTFCRLLTVSGEIFPWRFISATYTNGMWYLKDNRVYVN